MNAYFLSNVYFQPLDISQMVCCQKPTNKPTPVPTPAPVLSEIKIFDSGLNGGTSWTDNIINSSYNNNNPSKRPIVVYLTTDDNSDWMVGFTDNLVTITTKNDGQHYLKGALAAGQSETITNWRNSGLKLKVQVHEINTNVSPEYANVEITLESKPTANPTHRPTKLPTKRPTPRPSNRPTNVSYKQSECAHFFLFVHEQLLKSDRVLSIPISRNQSLQRSPGLQRASTPVGELIPTQMGKCLLSKLTANQSR